MNKKNIVLLSLTLLLINLLGACRKEEEPTPTSTSTRPFVQPTILPATAAPPTVTPEQTPEEQVEYNWAPQMVYNSPAAGEETKLDGEVTIRFDQPMDQGSLPEAFTLVKLGEERPIDGKLEWPRNDTFIFTPDDQLERNQLYEVRVSEGAKGRNGKALREPALLQLQTVGYLEVVQTIPEANTSDIDTDAVITIVFNRPVVPLVSTGAQGDLVHPLQFQPEVEGKGVWVSTSIYRFTPNEPLAGASQQTVTIPQGLTDVTGGELPSDYTWSFGTAGPVIVSTSVVDQEVGVAPNETITVTFNMPMDRPSTEGAISLNPDANLSFSWSDEDRVVSFRSLQEYELETDYELGISSGAQSANGRANLENGDTIRFTTVPYPAVLGTDPENGAESHPFQGGVTVRFASPMDLSTFVDEILIEPEPKRVSSFLTDADQSLYISFEHESNSEYQITIPGSAADPHGNTIGDDYTWRFQTPGLGPLVSFNLPFRVSQLSTGHPSDIDILHRNVSRIDLDLYRADDVEAALVSTNVTDYFPSGRPLRSWSIPVENVPEEVNVVTVALADGKALSPGFYFLQVNAPEITNEQLWWQNQRNVITVADSNLIVKEMVSEVHAWVTDIASGQPVGGAPLTLFDRFGRIIGTSQTASNGLASFPYQPIDDRLQGVLVVAQAPGTAGFGAASSSWSEGISPWEFGVPTAWHVDADRFGYLYTDRPIYRPGDTVHIKGIVRDKNYGRYPLPTREDIVLGLDFVSDYEPLTWEFSASLDDNGEFNGQYVVPEDARLGTYRLSFKESPVDGYLDFEVAEYRKPEFLVTVTPEQDELLRGGRTEVLVEAEFFFGGSASGLELDWSVYEKVFWLPWDGPYYSFNDSAGFNYETSPFFEVDFDGYLGDYVTGGQGTTDDDGRFIISLPADLLEESNPGSRLITVEASILGDNNLPVSGRSEIIFHDSEVYVGLVASEYIGISGTEVKVEILTLDWNTLPVGNRPVDIEFYKREWIPVQEEEFSTRFTRWEVEDTLVAQSEAVTDRQGKATTSFIPEDGGTYLAVATVTDSGGRSHISSTNLWIAGERFIGWRVDPRNKRMDLVADQQEYRPGDVADILVQSPLPGPVQAWLTVERGDHIDQRIITLETNSDIIQIPISDEYAPNVFVTISAVKGVGDDHPYADLRVGMTELTVSPEQLSLNVQLTPQQELLAPKDVAVFDIFVTDHLGNPVQANFSLALVDLAVLTLKPDNAEEIVEAFFHQQPVRSQLGSGLNVSGEGLEVEVPVQILGRGGGGGGAEERSSSVALIDEEEVRRDFPDTAYWEAKITTDASGRATIEIPLPDSLTTWRLSSKAVSDFSITLDTLVGQSSSDLVVTLPLLIKPITPRFFTVGDQLQIGAVVHNNTGFTQDVTVTLAAVGLTIDGPISQEVTIPDGGRAEVTWPVDVDDVTFADLTFRAKADEFQDATKPTFGRAPDQLIPVVRYTGEDFVGTSGVLESEGRVVEALLLPPDIDERQGQLQVQLAPSLGATLFDILDYVNDTFDRPICAHLIADRLFPNAAAVWAVEQLGLDRERLSPDLDDTIDLDLQRLAELQKRDGGWGWCVTADSDPYLSAYALLAVAKAEQAGFEADQNMVNNAADYVEDLLQPAGELNEAEQANRQAFYLYVLAELERVESNLSEDLFNEGRDLLDSYAKGLLLMALNGSGGSSSIQETLIADLNNEVILSAAGAHWEDAAPDWSNLSSDIRGTAMVLDALVQVDPESALGPGAVRWLVSSRTADKWPTGQQTAWSIQALADWLAVTGELDADYDYVLAVNGDPAAGGSFDDGSVTGGEQISLPVGTLLLEDTNFVDISRSAGEGRLYYTAYLDSFIQAKNLEPVSRGVLVERTYYDAACDPEQGACEPIDSVDAGQKVRVELTIIAPHDLVYAVIEDPIPSGAEALDPGLATTAAGVGPSFQRTDNLFVYGYWGWWYFNNVEFRDDRVVFLSDFLPAGTYRYTYTLQTALPGQFQVPPATARQEFFPEVFGRSSGFEFEITP